MAAGSITSPVEVTVRSTYLGPRLPPIVRITASSVSFFHTSILASNHPSWAAASFMTAEASAPKSRPMRAPSSSPIAETRSASLGSTRRADASDSAMVQRRRGSMSTETRSPPEGIGTIFNFARASGHHARRTPRNSDGQP